MRQETSSTTMDETPNTKETSSSNIITPQELMAMNRKDRRRIGKLNHVKIWGTNTAHLKEKPHALTTFTGIKK